MSEACSSAPVRGARRCDCRACPIRPGSEWGALGADGIALLNARKASVSLAPGQVVFHQAAPCFGLHCVQKGTLALRKVVAHGDGVIVRLVHEGQTVGCRTFFGGGTYSVTAEALTSARVCFIDRATVMDLLTRAPDLALRFARRLAEDLRATEDEKVDMVSGTSRQRVAHLLLLLADRYAEDLGPRGLLLQLPLARKDMGALLGVRAESVARAIRALQDDGVAQFRGRQVTIPCVERLMEELPIGA